MERQASIAQANESVVAPSKAAAAADTADEVKGGLQMITGVFLYLIGCNSIVLAMMGP